MPWEATTVADAKVKFIWAWREKVLRRELSMTALCERHGISRKTAYKWVQRFEAEHWAGLEERSRAPRDGLHWSEPEIIAAVLDTRLEFPEWGSRKIVAYLQEMEPERKWPQPSVAHEWMRRAGLVAPRVRGRRFPHPGKPPSVPIERPNQQWSVDFKGHFRTGDRRYCYPLTVADSYSRYVLSCTALPRPSFELVWPAFERLFVDYGLPEVILSDNGTPFSAMSVRRLSKLSVRWIRLGITPMLIQPGKPQQNGRHERMHRSLKEAACVKPSANCAEQQKQFDRFVDRFNNARPHEALGFKAPARLYEPSPRLYPKRLPEVEYPAGVEVRRVRSSGEIKWQGQWFFVTDALIGEPIGFELVADGCWIVRFSRIELGYYSELDRKLYLDRTRPDGKAENA